VPDIDLSSFYYSHREAFSPQENNNTQKKRILSPKIPLLNQGIAFDLTKTYLFN